MEVYVDGMLVKSQATKDHVADLKEAFATLRRYKMKLNPTKCAFGVTSGKFLEFMVLERGIEANPKKIRALKQMCPPKTIKEVQKLMVRRVSACQRGTACSASLRINLRRHVAQLAPFTIQAKHGV